MTMKWRKVGMARPELGNLINAAYFSGEVTILQIGKNDKAAIVPLSMVAEYQELMARQPSYADTTVEDAPRNEALPSEVVAEPAHSRPADRQAELAAAFEQPPIGPSDDDEDDEFAEELAELGLLGEAD